VRTTLSTKGQIVLPADIRRQDGLEAGHVFEVERLDRGDYRLRQVTTRANEGLVDWLLACPVKGFMGPVLPEETTDDIHPELR
jgi:AbrB family looped-hinge helix DNA binding protein